MGAGAALTAVAYPSATALASNLMSEPVQKPKDIRIGIIGAENSHTRGFGNMFNRWDGYNRYTAYNGYSPYTYTPYRYAPATKQKQSGL